MCQDCQVEFQRDRSQKEMISILVSANKWSLKANKVFTLLFPRIKNVVDARKWDVSGDGAESMTWAGKDVEDAKDGKREKDSVLKISLSNLSLHQQYSWLLSNLWDFSRTCTPLFDSLSLSHSLIHSSASGINQNTTIELQSTHSKLMRTDRFPSHSMPCHVGLQISHVWDRFGKGLRQNGRQSLSNMSACKRRLSQHNIEKIDLLEIKVFCRYTRTRSATK